MSKCISYEVPNETMGPVGFAEVLDLQTGTAWDPLNGYNFRITVTYPVYHLINIYINPFTGRIVSNPIDPYLAQNAIPAKFFEHEVHSRFPSG
jgi:hypothetical protein